jgi:hypothetical protein
MDFNSLLLPSKRCHKCIFLTPKLKNVFWDDDDDEDDAGIVETITDLLSSKEKQWPKKKIEKMEERATIFARPNFLVHKNHRIQNIIISHTVFSTFLLLTDHSFSSNTSPD